ncbi:MAG: MotA/TolQ/ExbB proton channel family protein [Synergistaceae bacterium]|jgi:chemotaxis protein MotA|nr:MotA/TolQ/ExbB proton channel family protein [Synergistaceae bacterium]
MDVMGVVGIITGFAALLIGMYFKGVPYAALNNPAAFFIILVGTAGAVIIATPGGEIKRTGKLIKVLFGQQRSLSATEAIDTLVTVAEMVRKEGILVMEKKLEEIPDPFMKLSFSIALSESNVQKLGDNLYAAIDAMKARHAAGAQIFTQAGMYAPTLGVLGAVLGLIAALSHMGDTDALGHAISAAFIATLLGIFTGYVLWHPFANRLKQKSKQEVFVKELICDGVLGIVEGENPAKLRERLMVSLPPLERERMEAAEVERKSGSK